MVTPTDRISVGFATVKPQINNQTALEISIDAEQLKGIKTHDIEGKKHLGISINVHKLKELLDGQRDFVFVHYCPDHKTNDKAPIWDDTQPY